MIWINLLILLSAILILAAVVAVGFSLERMLSHLAHQQSATIRLLNETNELLREIARDTGRMPKIKPDEIKPYL